MQGASMVSLREPRLCADRFLSVVGVWLKTPSLTDGCVKPYELIWPALCKLSYVSIIVCLLQRWGALPRLRRR